MSSLQRCQDPSERQLRKALVLGVVTEQGDKTRISRLMSQDSSREWSWRIREWSVGWGREQSQATSESPG